MELTNLSSSHLPHLISTNSFELNVSDSADSGLAISGSLSSGSDSRQVDRFELIESDADVSQLDSLDGSDGGMSAENFNTLKKVVIATIEPPPEFADSPHTTLIRSPHIQNYANHVAKKILTNALTCYTFLPKFEIQKRLREELRREQEEEEEIRRDADGNYFVSKPEPIYNENIYDTGGEVAKETFVLNLRGKASPKRVEHRKEEDDEEPTYDVPANYEDEASADTIWRSDKLNSNSTPRSKLFEGATSEIYDYDLYYNLKPTSSFDRRCTPPHCHKLYHYHQNSNMSTANRPNSRNSLNSRLSSSHNSLNVSTSNKVDDSIFITQAMSHDALMVHDISDFYNVSTL
jgi:suppressor of cytokine signaling 6/7